MFILTVFFGQCIHPPSNRLVFLKCNSNVILQIIFLEVCDFIINANSNMTLGKNLQADPDLPFQLKLVTSLPYELHPYQMTALLPKCILSS